LPEQGSIGLANVSNVILGELCAAQSDPVNSGNSTCCISQRERDDILDYTHHPGDHRQLADANELVHGTTTTYGHSITNLRVPAYKRIVDYGDIVPYAAVVAYMTAPEKKAVLPHYGLRFRFGTAMDRHVLAQNRAGPNTAISALARVLRVLRCMAHDDAGV
jgi:hypothetical protein